MEGVAKLILIFPRLKTAATMLLIVRMLRLVAAVFNRGKFSSATPSMGLMVIYVVC